MFNPYIAGNPVGGDTAFIGRQDVLREVTRVLANPSTNAIVLYGQRRIGKTSILQQLAQQLPQAGAYLPVYFDLQDKAAWPLDKVLFVLAQTISADLDLPQPESVTEVSFQQQFLPQVLAHLTQIESSLVFLFDEFDVLDNPTDQAAGKAFFPYLTRLLNLAPKQLQFVFVIGRKPEDLTNLTLQVFKNIAAQRVSLLNEADTRQVILLSQENGTLQWTEEAINEIWQLTNGHPYLTQMLGQTIWDAAYLVEPDDVPTVTLDMVTAALPKTIESSTNALEWLWQGLASAERFVSSALAQAGQKAISQDELEKLLTDNGVRVLISQLQHAPQLLVEWDLLERVNDGYRFRVELLRRWIAEKKPISRVRAELDQIEPVANNLYQAGKTLYLNGQTDQAIIQLRQALSFNPNHVDAGLLLAQLLMINSDGLDESIKLLEQVYAYNPSAAQYRLVQSLMAKSTHVINKNELLMLYNKVLVLDKNNNNAMNEKIKLLEQYTVTQQEKIVLQQQEITLQYQKVLFYEQQTSKLRYTLKFIVLSSTIIVLVIFIVYYFTKFIISDINEYRNGFAAGFSIAVVMFLSFVLPYVTSYVDKITTSSLESRNEGDIMFPTESILSMSAKIVERFMPIGPLLVNTFIEVINWASERERLREKFEDQPQNTKATNIVKNKSE